MYKATLATTVLAFATLSWQQPQQHQPRPFLVFKEEAMTLEYTVTENETMIRVAAETETALTSVDIRDPHGNPIMMMRTHRGRGLALSGFEIETEETEPGGLIGRYPEGTYEFRARTTDGRIVLGSASLSHELPKAPVILYPSEGELNVPSSNLTVRWQPQGEAEGYVVSLEQDDNDGITVNLDADTSQFTVPARILEPNTETQVEVGAIGSNGNCTLVEVTFMTR